MPVNQEEADAWAKHLACLSLPDASKESEVNTYISIAETELVSCQNQLEGLHKKGFLCRP